MRRLGSSQCRLQRQAQLESLQEQLSPNLDASRRSWQPSLYPCRCKPSCLLFLARSCVVADAGIDSQGLVFDLHLRLLLHLEKLCFHGPSTLGLFSIGRVSGEPSREEYNGKGDAFLLFLSLYRYACGQITHVPKKATSDNGIRDLLASLHIPYPTTAIHIGRRPGELPNLVVRCETPNC
jgi:hypothetical protein